MWLSQAPKTMQKVLKGRIQNMKLSNNQALIYYDTPPPSFFLHFVYCFFSLRLPIIFWTRKLFQSQVPWCCHGPSSSVGGSHPTTTTRNATRPTWRPPGFGILHRHHLPHPMIGAMARGNYRIRVYLSSIQHKECDPL